MATASELSINATASAVAMAETIFGAGVSVLSATYSGSFYSSGTYSGGDTTSPGVVPGDTGVILSTGSVGNFTRASGDPNQSTAASVNSGGQNNAADFNAIAGARTYDASYLETRFIPDTDTMTMRFVFSSDEYPEYVNTLYTDVVGVWINGSHVPVSVLGEATSVDSVNSASSENLFVSNATDDFNTEMDGFTVTMTLTIPVNAGVENTLKIGIADVGDNRVDSNLLIAGDSVQTDLVAIQDDVTIAQGETVTLDVLGNDINNTSGSLVITHINGVAVVAGDTVTLATGQEVTLNADGTLDITTDNDLDTISFTYDVASIGGTGNGNGTGNGGSNGNGNGGSNGNGNNGNGNNGNSGNGNGNNGNGNGNGGSNTGQTLATDTGYVTVTTIPCFVAGTLIRTPEGEVPVEMLMPGMMVDTLDDGPQPLRWIGQRRVAATGALAPIRIRRGAFGNHEELLVSPQHRVLVRDAKAEMLFGEKEVLVAAKDLVDGRSVRRQPGGEVCYVHLLFDRHQILWSGGLATESFLPGPQTTALLDRDVVAEICRIFPELEPLTGAGYSPAARRTLRRYEAALLMDRAA